MMNDDELKELAGDFPEYLSIQHLIAEYVLLKKNAELFRDSLCIIQDAARLTENLSSVAVEKFVRDVLARGDAK